MTGAGGVTDSLRTINFRFVIGKNVFRIRLFSGSSDYHVTMKNIRPFGWVIITLNAYFFFSFFKDYDPSASDTANGFGFMFLIFWLAIMNTFLYVLYRITGGKKRECPACGVGVKKGLTVCPSCNFDFMKSAKGITD